MTAPLKVERTEHALVLTLDRPKANILDRAMMGAIREALPRAKEPSVRAVIFQASGPHFSFGASVEEHRPAEAPQMLREFHGMVKELLGLPVPCLAAVRGQCLGGAMELVLACSYVALGPDAKLGQPEIKLASFAPFASAMLPWKCGQGRAERLLLTGAPVDAATAVAYGLADVVSEDPEAAVRAFVTQSLAPLSPVAIRYALAAARAELLSKVGPLLDRLEAMYVTDLLGTDDAKEGIAAFIEKRAPKWTSK